MKRFHLFFWLIIFVVFPIWGNDRAPLATILPVLESYVEKSIVAEGIPGAVVVIVKDGKIAYLKGFGVKIVGQSNPVDEHTPFALASLSKNFTNTLVARLVDEGRLQWQDKVSKYLPDFQLSDSKILHELTIEDLLSHRSGLPGFSADSLLDLGWSAPEIIAIMKAIPTEGEFRKTHNYQNLMVGLMGNIIEKVTGKPLAQLYREELFQPLGMAETRVGGTPPLTFWQKISEFFRKKDPQPALHDSFRGKTRYLPKGNPGLYTFPASSGIISTGYDIGKWLIFQLNKGQSNGKTIVSEFNMNKMRTPHVDVEIRGGRQWPKNRVTKLQYGLGWFIHDYAGIPMLGHMGGVAGTRAYLTIIPEDNLGIAILTNFGGMRVSLFPEAIRNKFLDLYLNIKEDVDWAKKAREDIQNYREKYNKQRQEQMLQNLAPARDLDDYTGVYENSLYGRVEVVKKDDELTLIYRDRPQTRLTHWNGNTFQFEASELSSGFSGTDQGEIVFSEGRGKANRMMINLFHEGTDSVFHRVG